MQTIVLSLGGSLLAPDGIDWEYLETFCDFIQQKSGVRWIIVVGGGSPVRKLITHILGDEQKDLVGIAMTRVNAQIVISHLKNVYPHVLTDTTLPEGYDYFVSGGFTPGRTTDDVAMQFAIAHKADFVINLTNVPGVYIDTQVQEEILFERFLTMFPAHKPGIHAPFDPIAARRAKQHDMCVHVVSGKNFANLENVLSEKQFEGTVLKN